MPFILAIPLLLVCLAAGLGYGGLWLRAARCSPLGDAWSAVQACALGLGTLAYLILGAGLVGWWHSMVFAALLALGVGLLALSLWREGRGGGAPEPPPNSGGAAILEKGAYGLGAIVATRGLQVSLGVFALVTLFSALTPPNGLDWDSLSYHLAAPKIWLREGRITLLAYDHHSNFPFTLEMLYALGLAFQGPALAKLFHWSCGWLTTAAVGLLAARLAARGSNGPPAPWIGPLAAALFAAMPVVLWEMGTTYVDLGTALFQLLALGVLVEAISRQRDGSWAVDGCGVAQAGAFSGFALGTKYTALLQFGLLGLGLLFVALRAGSNARRALARLAQFGVVAAVLAAPWYLKNWLWVHNPVYPFFYGLFPQSFSWGPGEARAYAGEQVLFGYPKTLGNLATTLWNLGLNAREYFANGKPAIGDQVGSLGPAWAGLLPLVCWVRGLGWRAGALLAYGLASIGLWFILSQQVRYLMPVFAPLAVVAALVVAGLPTRPLRLGAGSLCVLSLVGGFVLHAPLLDTAIPLVTGQVTEEQFLAANHGDLYDAARWVNSELPRSARVALYSETRGFLIDRDYLWANPGHHRLIPYEQCRSGADLVAALRRYHVTHVLVNYSFSRDQGASPWYRLLMDAVQTGALEQEYATTRAEFGRRGIIVYRLTRL